MSAEDTRRLMLEEYDKLINQLQKGKVKKHILESIYALRKQVEKAGAIELYTKHLHKPILEELDSIIAEVQSSELRKKQCKEFKWRLGFFLVVPCYFWIYTFTSLQNKILSSGQVAFVVWIMMGILTVTITLPIFVYYSFVTNKLVNLTPLVFTKVTNTQKLFFIKIAVIVFESLMFGFAFSSVFSLFIALYPRISSPLATLVKQAFMMDIASIMGVVSLIIGDLAALIAIYDFFEKKLQKRDEDSSS